MIQNGAAMKKCNNFKTLLSAAAVLLAAGVFIYPYASGIYEQYREEHSGIPDAVSSMTRGGVCRLTVVANTSKIEEPDQFAEQVIRICRENGFQTIHFSEDLGGLPSSLFIAVYLKKSDVDKGEPVLRIRYEPLSCAGNSNEESDEEYTIADPPSEYRLTVEDGR